MSSPHVLAIARLTPLKERTTQPPISASAQLVHGADGRKILHRIKNAPGMHLNIALSAAGAYVEDACRWSARQFGLGPDAASKEIQTVLGLGPAHLDTLDYLHALRADLPTTRGVDEKLHKQIIQKLSKLCKKVLRYTDRCVYFLLRRVTSSYTKSNRTDHSFPRPDLYRSSASSSSPLTTSGYASCSMSTFSQHEQKN